jgi:YVTN family beta-propeller protein
MRGLLGLLLCAGLKAQPLCSPAALAATSDGRTLYVGCASGPRVEVFDTAERKIARTIPVPAPVSGLLLWPGESRLVVTGGGVHLVDLASGKLARSVRAGHTPAAPVLSPDRTRLYVSNRFDNDVSAIDTATWKEIRRLKAVREPAGAALSRDGRLLFAINSVPAGRADVEHVAAEINVIDTASGAPAGRITLPNGSAELREIDVSPDGSLAAVTHLVARYYLPATQLDRGWMETNALTIIDLAGRQRLATVLLDEIDQGAANPWAVRWAGGGKSLLVTHAGTHEVSLIDAAAMIDKVRKPARDPSEDLTFLVGLRQRIALAGRGPRALAVAGGRAWVAGYFSDTLEEIDLERPAAAPTVIARLSQAPMTTVRRGEMLFNDASICFQGWQSCVSCHSPDARVDGLNWDLLNDGIGNPKNAKSLLLAHRTPPAMSQGVRESAEAAVRAGFRHILFARRPEDEAIAIDEFLKSLQPVPSPHLVNGALSAAAQRGKKLFLDAKAGCAVCHPPGLYTDMQPYDVGTGAPFDTPTLVEIWRTAPYLHNGSAATIEDVLTGSNRNDKHGRTAHLNKRQVADLVAYLLSL